MPWILKLPPSCVFFCFSLCPKHYESLHFFVLNYDMFEIAISGCNTDIDQQRWPFLLLSFSPDPSAHCFNKPCSLSLYKHLQSRIYMYTAAIAGEKVMSKIAFSVSAMRSYPVKGYLFPLLLLLLLPLYLWFTEGLLTPAGTFSESTCLLHWH